MRKRSKVALWIAGVVVFAALTAWRIRLCAFSPRSIPACRKPNIPHRSIWLQAQRQDFDYFRNYFNYNKAYSPAARDEAKETARRLCGKGWHTFTGGIRSGHFADGGAGGQRAFDDLHGAVLAASQSPSLPVL